MKQILLSMQVRHASNVRIGFKTAELRTRPLPVPCRVFVYEGRPCGKITCEFVCYDRGAICEDNLGDVAYLKKILHTLQLSEPELRRYLLKPGYIHPIEYLMVYPRPRKLAEFGLDLPPQSWQYLTSEQIPKDLRVRMLEPNNADGRPEPTLTEIYFRSKKEARMSGMITPTTDDDGNFYCHNLVPCCSSFRPYRMCCVDCGQLHCPEGE